jgi:hypothetical protein
MRFLPFALLLVAAPVAAAPDPIRLGAKTHGSALELTFTNVTGGPLEISKSISAGVTNYDWLTVNLVPKTGSKDPAVVTRQLHFTTERLASALITAKLAPGGTTTEAIDLVPWALRDGGAPLAPGTYELTATWDASRDSLTRFSARVTATLTIGTPIAWPTSCASATGNLELLARHTTGTMIEVGLHNAGAAAICIQAPEGQCSLSEASLTLAIDPGKPKSTVIHFEELSICDKTTQAPVVELPPGATLWKRSSLGTIVSRGLHHIDVTYEMPLIQSPQLRSNRKFAVWRGKLTMPIAMTVP